MINYLAVLVAGIVSMILAFVRYSPQVFGSKWMKLAGIKKTSMKVSSAVLGLVTSLVTAAVLAYFLDLTGTTDWQGGLLIGFLVWLGFQGTLTLGSVLWEKKPVGLYVLNNGFNLLSALIMAVILTLWV